MTTNTSSPDLVQALNVATANVFVIDADLQIEFCNRQAMQSSSQLGAALSGVGLSASQLVGSVSSHLPLCIGGQGGGAPLRRRRALLVVVNPAPVVPQLEIRSRRRQ